MLQIRVEQNDPIRLCRAHSSQQRLSFSEIESMALDLESVETVTFSLRYLQRTVAGAVVNKHDFSVQIMFSEGSCELAEQFGYVFALVERGNDDGEITLQSGGLRLPRYITAALAGGPSHTRLRMRAERIAS